MKSIDELVKTVARLRSPDGCPWDKEQTHNTLKRYLIEEAYETLEAIDNNDSMALMEELGDVLLQIILHAQIASETKQFTLEDVADYINKKMIKRHPHVFSNVIANTKEEVLVNWEKLKKEEKPERKDIFDGIPASLPALLKALKVSKKAAREGFDWSKESSIWEAMEKEIKELREAVKLKDKEQQEEELGDVLFMITNIARWYKLDPEDTLNKGIKKFIKRYTRVKELSKDDLSKLSEEELNKLWEKAKLGKGG